MHQVTAKIVTTQKAAFKAFHSLRAVVPLQAFPHRQTCVLLAALFGILGSQTVVAEPIRWPDISESSPDGGGENDVAIVVGIDRYAFVAPVPGATRNAADWYKYLVQGHRIPTANIRFLRNEDATVEGMRAAVAETTAAAKSGATLWFVFVGHGAPDRDGKQGVLVGWDVQQKANSLYARSLPQSELLATISHGRQSRTIVVLDACFSGQTASGGSLAPGLQPLLVWRLSNIPVHTLIMTAGQSNEFAGPLPGANRPAFSYLLLGSLRGWGDVNLDGKVTAAEAVSYAAEAIKILVTDRNQTPQIVGDLGSTVLSRHASERGPSLLDMVLRGAADSQAADAAVTHSPPAPSQGTAARRGSYQRGLALTQSGNVAGAALEFADGCEKDEADACNYLAWMYDEGEGVTKDRRRALGLYSKACSGGSGLACSMLGALYSTGEGVAKDSARAAGFFTRACDLGEAMVGCNNLAEAYASGTGVAKDQRRAVSLLSKSCDAGAARACGSLGIAYAEGRVGLAKNPTHAVKLLSKACDAGEERSCSNLGVMYLYGQGVERDEMRSLHLISKACDAGYADACSNLGAMYASGNGCRRDDARALRLYAKACDTGGMNGCNNLADRYSSGKGVDKDEARAVRLLTRSCEAGDAIGCHDLGIAYEKGLGVAKDIGLALTAFSRACEKEERAGSCNHMGFLFLAGREVPQDMPRAVGLFGKACDLGEATACSNLGAMYSAGLGVQEDMARAEKLYQKSCDAGDADGCQRLGSMFEEGNGVRADRVRAAAFFSKACKLGNSDSCSRRGSK